MCTHTCGLYFSLASREIGQKEMLACRLAILRMGLAWPGLVWPGLLIATIITVLTCWFMRCANICWGCPRLKNFKQACKVCYPNLKPFGLRVCFRLGKLSRTVWGRSLDSERSLLINFDPSKSSSCSNVNCLLQSACSTHLCSNLPVLANTLKLCTLQMSHLSATPMPTHSQTHKHTLEAAVNCNNNCQTALAAIVGAVNACATVDNCIKLAGHTRLTAGAAILPLESSIVGLRRVELSWVGSLLFTFVYDCQVASCARGWECMSVHICLCGTV